MRQAYIAARRARKNRMKQNMFAIMHEMHLRAFSLFIGDAGRHGFVLHLLNENHRCIRSPSIRFGFRDTVTSSIADHSATATFSAWLQQALRRTFHFVFRMAAYAACWAAGGPLHPHIRRGAHSAGGAASEKEAL